MDGLIGEGLQAWLTCTDCHFNSLKWEGIESRSVIVFRSRGDEAGNSTSVAVQRSYGHLAAFQLLHQAEHMVCSLQCRFPNLTTFAGVAGECLMNLDDGGSFSIL